MITGLARADGADIAFNVRGEGPSTVLLVMGLAGRSGDWGEPFPSALARHHRVITFDNRGTGKSTHAPGPYTLRSMARDAIAVLDEVDVDRAHVLGISMGGMIAQQIAISHRDRVDRLVLISTHGGGPRVVAPSREVMALLTPNPAMRGRDQVRARMIGITAPGFAERRPEVIDELVRIAVAEPTPLRSFIAQLGAILASDRSDRLSEIVAPTLVVHGDRDPLIPYANGHILAEAIPNARLATLKGCGHLPMWEACAELTGAIEEFLRPA